MSNIHLKVIIETLSKLRFSGFKKFLHFKTSCCNLKIRDPLFFCYFNFERNYDLLKLKILFILLKKSINFKKPSKIENGKPHTQVYKDEPCASAHIRMAN